MTISTDMDFGSLTSNAMSDVSLNVMPASTFYKFITDTKSTSDFLASRLLSAFYGSAVAQVFFASRNIHEEDASPKYVANNQTRLDNALSMVYWLHTRNFRPTGDEFGTIESTIEFCKESYSINKARVSMINNYVTEYSAIDGSFHENMTQIKAKTLSENLAKLDPKFHALMEAKIAERVENDVAIQKLAEEEAIKLCNIDKEVQLTAIDETYLYSAFSKLVETVDNNGVIKEGKIVTWIKDATKKKLRENRDWYIKNWATNITLMNGMLIDAKVILKLMDSINIVDVQETDENDIEPSQKVATQADIDAQVDKDCANREFHEDCNFPVV